MTHHEIYGKVVQIIASFVKDGDALKEASAGTRLQENLGVNSARFVDIILAFEDAFGVEIDFDAMDEMRTIGDAVALIEAKRSAARA